MYRKKSVRDFDIAPGDRALVRVDYNVTFVGDSREIYPTIPESLSLCLR